MLGEEIPAVPPTQTSDPAPTVTEPTEPRPPLWWPVVLLVTLTAVFRFTDLDFMVTDAFYVHGVGFPFKHALVARVLHDLCPVIVALVVLNFVVVIVGSIWSRRLRSARVVASFLLVAMALGPGLVVNTLFKGHFGRPRPSEVTRYGGQQEFRPVWEWGPRVGQSFPSGDASIGFYFGVPAFLVWRARPREAWGFLGLGLLVGAVFGMARIAQGAHWASDVLWSGGFVYLAGYVTGELFHAAGKRAGEHPR
jgi:membrane-associated PAP2 superfamily phosphatase